LHGIAMSTIAMSCLVALCAAPVAEVVNTPGSTDEQIATIVQHYLDDQVNTVTENASANRLLNTGELPADRVTGRLSAALSTERPRIARLRDAIRGTMDEFDRGTATMVNPKLAIDGETAKLVVTESTALHYDRRPASMAQFTSYSVTHTFALSEVNGAWTIENDTLAIPAGAPQPFPYERRSQAGTAQADKGSFHGLTPTRNPQGKPAPSKRLTPEAIGYNRADAVSYAVQFAISYNHQYVSFDDDCANFVSQALHMGGWTVDGSWYFTVGGIPRAPVFNGSNTWVNSEYLAEYGFNNNRFRAYAGEIASNGDVVFADWNDTQGNYGADGSLDHTMIITDIGDGWDWDTRSAPASRPSSTRRRTRSPG